MYDVGCGVFNDKADTRVFYCVYLTVSSMHEQSGEGALDVLGNISRMRSRW